MIYLDNAATSGKKPPEVKKAVMNALEKLSANPGRSGHRASVAAAEAVYEVREKASRFFGGYGSEKVVFTANCTAALNIAVKGILKSGDHAVVSDLEHNAVMRPLKAVTDNISVAAVSLTDDDETAENFRKSIRAETKLVICTAASNVVGKMPPLEKIGRICREKGVPFLVDGAQGGGVIPIDMRKMNIDHLCLAPHKGLYAPMGSGVLISNGEIGRTLLEGGTGDDSLSFVQKPVMPQGFESGTVCLPAICGAGAGFDFVGRIGRENIYRHETALVCYLFDRLSSLDNVILYAPRPEADAFAPVLSFNVAGRNSEEVAGVLDQNGIAVRAGFHCSKAAHEKLKTTSTGVVRVSPSVFNGRGDIDRLFSVVKKL